MATILLTGATGTVGSILAPLLNKKGHRIIYLTRAKNGQQAEDRILAGNIVWQGDITILNCGVSISQRNQIWPSAPRPTEELLLRKQTAPGNRQYWPLVIARLKKFSRLTAES